MEGGEPGGEGDGVDGVVVFAALFVVVGVGVGVGVGVVLEIVDYGWDEGVPGARVGVDDVVVVEFFVCRGG